MTAKCTNCPRECGADRENRSGYCRAGSGYSVDSIVAHRGEEPPLSGANALGICNIFFSHCNLQCVYCQNYQISGNKTQLSEISLKEITDKVCAMLNSGIKNVGFVSPSHVIEQVKDIIASINKTGSKPIYVFNTNGYDKKETIESLEDIISVYLPDFKYADSKLAAQYSDAADYPQVAVKALREMYRQKGSNLALDEDSGIARSGLIIRHLILPGHAQNSKDVLRMIADELSTSVHISLMSQYFPTPAVQHHPQLGRNITQAEYEEVLDEFHRLGFYRGWIQGYESSANYVPDFEKESPFE